MRAKLDQGNLNKFLVKASSFLENRSLRLLFLGFAIFEIIWGVIVISKYYSMNTNVFDLGFAMERLWQIYNIHSINFDIFIIFNSGIQFILSPLYFFHSFQLLLLFQVFMLGLAAFPLYGIALRLIRSKPIALLVSICYLSYFPSSGILWFDIHFQAFFVPLFIFGYYFYLREKYTISLLIFLLSGLVRFPYMIFPFAFALIEMIVLFKGKRVSETKIRKFLILLMLFSIIFLIGGFYYSLLPSNFPITYAGTSIKYRLFYELLTFMILFSPLLFLPLFSVRWAVLTIPFFTLGLYSGSTSYFFPFLFFEQYTSMVLPILFLGTIDTISKLRDCDLSDNRKGVKPINLRTQTKLKVIKRFDHRLIVIFLLIVVVSGAMVYSPAGPLNSYSTYTYSLAKNINYNQTNFHTLQEAEQLIPRDNPYVLFQNDMPQMLPRPSPPNTSIPFLFSIYISSNLSLQEVINNTFPLLFATANTSKYVPVDYLIAYEHSTQFYFQVAGNENTLPNIMHLMLKSGRYSEIFNKGGFVVLKRD